jgi:hypothetical protein
MEALTTSVARTVLDKVGTSVSLTRVVDKMEMEDNRVSEAVATTVLLTTPEGRTTSEADKVGATLAESTML